MYLYSYFEFSRYIALNLQNKTAGISHYFCLSLPSYLHIPSLMIMLADKVLPIRG